MSALALLRDVAGCRAVLHDAMLEERPAAQVAELERVAAEAEAALWGGCEAERVNGWVYRRTAPERPDVSEEAFDDHRYDAWDPDVSYEDAHRAWADERRREYRGRVRAYLAADWLAWDDRGRRARLRRGMYGEGLASFAEILRERYPETEPPWRAGGSGPALGSDAMRERIAHTVGAIADVGSEPAVLYMNPEAYAQLQARRRAELLTGHRRAALAGRRSGKTAAARASALARVYGTGAFEVPRGARGSFDAVAMPPTSSAPHAFERPSQRDDGLRASPLHGLMSRLLADQRRRDNPADVFGDGREWSRDLSGTQRRTGYRPRWAPALAATLSEILFMPLVPAGPTPRRGQDVGIEVRCRAWADLLTDGPASGVPGMGDP